MTSSKLLGSKSILITGGTGSFGQAAARRLLDGGAGEIKIFSRDEKKQDDMRKLFDDSRLKFILGDVRDYDSIEDAMYGVDYVFSAAALKQVPSCEFYPLQAVATNITGTENTMRAAIKHAVSNVVVLSTDKAVFPINAMGMSKALMEKVAISKSRENLSQGTKISITRYGNVMASRGSVIPLFVDQILRGGPITITYPKMTRFMMALEEAVELVMFAFQNSHGGEVFIQKSPAATVEQIANALIKIFNSSCEINEIGIRHGEKIHEVLMTQEERFRSDDLDIYFRINPDSRGLNYQSYVERGNDIPQNEGDYTSASTQLLDDQELEVLLRKLPLISSLLNN